METLSIAVPYASTDPRRQRIFEWTRRRWELLVPEAQICIGESDPSDFSRSAACNDAVAKTTGSIVLIADADVACNLDMIRAALHRVREGHAPWVIAHTVYHELSEALSDKILTRPPDTQFAPPYEGPSSTKSEAGVLVMRRVAFERAGGYDERFIGWGYEDTAFAAVMTRTAGNYERVPGDMLHLWHEPGLRMQQPHIEHNRRLYREIAT